MTVLLENPTTGQDTPADFDGEYLFFVGFVIVGWSNADCWVCAWKEGYAQWRDCRMALAREYEASDAEVKCEERRDIGEWVFFNGGYIVGWVFADCRACALRKGLPYWPGSRLGLVVPCDPRDVYLECRIDRRKRGSQG
jgi:hypothetical protein